MSLIYSLDLLKKYLFMGLLEIKTLTDSRQEQQG